MMNYLSEVLSREIGFKISFWEDKETPLKKERA